MQIAAAAGMNRWSRGNTGNVRKPERSGPHHRGRLMMMLLWIILFSSPCLMVEGQMKIPPETVQQWAISFSKDIAALSARYSGAKLLQKKYKDVESVVKMEEVDGEELVKTFAEEMEEMLGRKMKSVKRLAEAAEDADLYHEYNATLEFDYYNSLLINMVDEDGNSLPLGGDFALEKNEHFNKLPVNTQLSNIQVPTNVYNKDTDILNGAYMSEALNDVFIDNFKKDPTLTWQYFGSSTGFFRLYPDNVDWTVRVFTYLIGREMTFADNTKWIACNNKGYYTHISTLADVQENVMEYLHVLSRPMVINHDHDIIWTEAYMDSVLFNTQAQSLLLMTSVAMPVFSKKEETLSHGILLGVVGTDVALRELMKMAPRYKLGVHGYAYLITNNGYILSHPDLRPLYKEGKKLKPKPNYNSVDLSEVEWEDTEEKLRTAMVKGENGAMSLDVRTSVDKGTRVMFLKNDYFYTVINETPFSLGIVLTRGHGEFIFFGNVSVEEGLHDLQAPDLTIPDEWTYCELDIDPGHRKLDQLQAVVRFLMGKEPELECDMQLIQQTLFDAVVTAPMEAYWTALMLNTSGMDEGVETAFLGTRSGLMRFQRYTGIEKRLAKSFLTASDKENMFTLDHFPVWYRRAAENPAGQFLYYMPRKETRDVFRDYEADYSATLSAEEVEREAEEGGRKQTGRIVIATTAITVTVGKRTAIAGAIGVQMTLELMESRFWAIAAQPNDTDCSNVEGICPLRCDSIDIECYVIDNNGFVLISKQRNDAGRFFGEIDGSVMTTLIRMGMFKRVSLFDYQAMCKMSSHSVSSARPLLSPFYGLASALKWFLSNFLLFLLEFNICGLWHTEPFADAKPSFTSSSHKKKGDILQPCDTEYPSFVYEPSVKETNSIIKCGRCQKMFVVQQIPNSNLLMLVVQADCDCSRQHPPINMNPKEVRYNASVKCDRMRSQKIRRRPESCHAYHPQENANDCGGASVISLSASLFLFCLSFSALVS
ncbi:voltage-dependent calcium channel subunit alpha-2/delta-4 [Scomber scombrus]|uniref:voltage-dependent calcium channel subunit alpha-2/delta-4 n=1 Tax=Scomber scombrus TaxID=13677 RepID=UPI002DD7B2A9|nr:voltage-dependent calcium channel subunit alpha-2/delta-4 [Scomber scombrus]